MKVVEGKVSHVEKGEGTDFRLDGAQCYFAGDAQIAEGDHVKGIGKPYKAGFHVLAIRNYTTGIVFRNDAGSAQGWGTLFLLASLPGFLAFLGPESSALIFCFLLLLPGIPL
jgi:hypothetical protein